MMGKGDKDTAAVILTGLGTLCVLYMSASTQIDPGSLISEAHAHQRMRLW